MSRFFFIITILFYSVISIAQNEIPVAEFRSMFITDVNSKHKHTLSKPTSTFGVPIYGIFKIYKKLVSSQDGNKCIFIPTCSEYAIDALNRKGLLIGVLETADRVLRCNSFSQKDQQTGLNKTRAIYDPVY